MKRTLVLSALAVASTLALAACGEATESSNTDATTSATSTATTTAETTETTTATTEADGEISADHNDADIMWCLELPGHAPESRIANFWGNQKQKISRHRPERCLETSQRARGGVWFGDIVPHVS